MPDYLKNLPRASSFFEFAMRKKLLQGKWFSALFYFRHSISVRRKRFFARGFLYSNILHTRIRMA